MNRFEINEAAGTVLDTYTGLTWQRAEPPQYMTWEEATQYAKELTLDGGGWRLPTVEELFLLVDRSLAHPAIDVVAFPTCPQSGTFWTSTLRVADQRPPSRMFWTVTTWEGIGSYSGDYNRYRVRCVRGSKA